MNANFQNPRRFAGPVVAAVVVAIGFLVSPAFAQDNTNEQPSDNSSEMKDRGGEGKSGKVRGRNGRGLPGQWQKEGEGEPKENRDGKPRRPGSGKGNPGERMMQMFANMDKDGNGTIDKSEAPERLLNRFDQIDTSGDGQIDKDEIRAMVEMMAERMRRGMEKGKPGEGKPGDIPPPGGKRKRGGGENGNDGSPNNGSVDPVRPGSGGGSGDGATGSKDG